MHGGRIAFISGLVILCAVGAVGSDSTTSLVAAAFIAVAACFAARRAGGGFVIALLAAAHAIGLIGAGELATSCADLALFGSMSLVALEIAWWQDAREARWCKPTIPPARVR